MFFPIENVTELARLRSLMSPFMTNIQKCFDVRNHSTILKENVVDQKERIADDVINSVSSFVEPELLNGLNRIIAKPRNRTLGLEQNALRQMSIRLFYFEK